MSMTRWCILAILLRAFSRFCEPLVQAAQMLLCGAQPRQRSKQGARQFDTRPRSAIEEMKCFRVDVYRNAPIGC